MSAPKREDTIEVTIPVLEINRADRNIRAIEEVGRRLKQDNQRIDAHRSLRDNISIGVSSFLLCAVFFGASLAVGEDGKPDLPLGGVAAGVGILSLAFCRKAWNARPDCLPLTPEDRLALEKEYVGRTEKYDAFLTRNLGEALPSLKNK